MLQPAARRVLDKHPSIAFAGLRDGYFTREQEADVVRQIRSSRADCLFIGIPSPRKERFLASHRDALGVPFMMGVGGSFDILAGAVRRAPVRVQHLARMAAASTRSRDACGGDMPRQYVVRRHSG